jgi:hypothetical protein
VYVGTRWFIAKHGEEYMTPLTSLCRCKKLTPTATRTDIIIMSLKPWWTRR